MLDVFCTQCHSRLSFSPSGRRAVCFTCNRLYGEDYPCKPCSKRDAAVLMEIVAPGKVRCALCGSEKDAPGLNLETSMTRRYMPLAGQPIRSIPPRTSIDKIRPSHVAAPRGTSKRYEDRIAQFPERADADIVEDEYEISIIVEFPRHNNKDDISWRVENNTLFISSNFEDCSYQNTIALPLLAGEPRDAHLRNGIFTITFIKSHNRTIQK